MPINVVCPGCHKRFAVGEQHAGKQGPCPKCKTVIDIPKVEDEVVIHAPTDALGPTDAKGRPVLKTTKAKDGKFNPVLASVVAGVSLLFLVAAVLLRGSGNPVLLGGGAVLLGPLLAWAGYGFLRDSELEPYQGNALLIRTLACGLGFAAGWGAYAILGYQLSNAWPIGELEIFQLVLVTGAAVGVGVLASYVSLDLEPTMGGVHFALYFIVTILLRVVMDLPVLPGMASG